MARNVLATFHPPFVFPFPSSQPTFLHFNWKLCSKCSKFRSSCAFFTVFRTATLSVRCTNSPANWIIAQWYIPIFHRFNQTLLNKNRRIDTKRNIRNKIPRFIPSKLFGRLVSFSRKQIDVWSKGRERERKEKKIEIFTIRIQHGSGSIDVDDKHETEILSPTIYHWCISPRLSCLFVPLESRHRSGLLACFDTLNYCPGTGAAATCKRSPHMALGLYIGGCVRIASFQLLRKCTASRGEKLL